MKTIKLFSLGVLMAASGAASANECYSAAVVSPSPFMGNHGEIVKLTDGTLWEVQYEYQYLYEYNPAVIICPGRGKLVVKDKSLNVTKVGGRPAAPAKQKSQPQVPDGDYIESQIDGNYEGWAGETIVKLMNGQVWQQSEYYYTYRYAFMPKVIIFRAGAGYKMKVDGVDKAVGVIRLR